MLPSPSPSLIAFLHAFGRAAFSASVGGRAHFPRSSEVDGCTVTVFNRFACKGTVTVSASDGDCVITFEGGRAVVSERAGNLGSSRAFALARLIAGHINAM